MYSGGIGIVIKLGQLLLEVIEIIGSKFIVVMIEGEVNVMFCYCFIDGSNILGVVVSDFVKLKVNDCIIWNNFLFYIQNVFSYEIDVIGNIWDLVVLVINLFGKIRIE